MDTHAHWSPEERDRLEQELLELHFGCHEEPAALEARLEAEPALRALQQQVLAHADVLARAVRPEQPRLDLAGARTATRSVRWLSSPWLRFATLAAAALVAIGVMFTRERIARWRADSFQRDHLHLTVSAPRAVPAAAPWNFTVVTEDLAGRATDARVRWQTIAANGSTLASGEIPVVGRATVQVPGQLVTTHRLEIIASTGQDEVRQAVSMATSAAGPLVHVDTDRPIYRPGETVRVRSVVLDRVTCLPLRRDVTLAAELRDGRDAVLARGAQVRIVSGVGWFELQVPADSGGGACAVRVAPTDGSFAAATADVVVRPFQNPQLAKRIVLDRKSYAPGARGSAAVQVRRLGDDGAASGGLVRAALLVDGEETWSEERALGADGGATFAFVVPRQVQHGAGRFVATVRDGGVTETAVETFVVPTGTVHVAAFPEGGELVAGVDNCVYLECTDSLGRAVDSAGELVDGHDRRITTFRTAHQGRVKLAFVPARGEHYRVRLSGEAEGHTLPAVRDQGIAMRLLGDDLAPSAPLRMALAGRGNGPWVLGVFSRGVMVGQTTVRPDASGELRTTAEVELTANAAGVLRATLFDRELQPVAERLVRRHAAQRLEVTLTAARDGITPGDEQSIAIATRDELGRPVPAVIGLTCVDDAALALGRDPRVGIVDHAMLWTDVERLEDLGDFFLDDALASPRVDLLLGTRGWRRFVWRNDESAQAAIAARGPRAADILSREGFSHAPQVSSNLTSAQAPLAPLQDHRRHTERHLAAAFAIAILVLLLHGLAETIAWLLRRSGGAPIGLQVFGGLAGAAMLVLVVGAALPRTLETRSSDPGAAVLTMLEDFALAADGEAVGGQWDSAPLPETTWSLADGDSLVGDPDAIEDVVAHGTSEDVDREPRALLAPAARPAGLPTRDYAHRYRRGTDRSDFTATICWHALLLTDERGRASTTFATSDAVTTWRVHADAHVGDGDVGRLGQAETTFTTRLPLHVDAKLPDAVMAGDRLRIPVAATATDARIEQIGLHVDVGDGLRLAADTPRSIGLEHDVATGHGRGRSFVDVEVTGHGGTATIALDASAGRFVDRVRHRLRIAPRGFPHTRSAGGTVAPATADEWRFTIPDGAVAGTGRASLKIYPSPLSALTEGLAGIVQEPHGCFEQASSANYPNTLVLSLLDATGDDLPMVAARARELLPRGYARITGFECARRGYEWFGHDPGHDALTAYGLLEFTDMAKVHDVDRDMVERTRRWLLARRDGSGGFLPAEGGSHGFGGEAATQAAYLCHALLQAGTPAAELRRELDALGARVPAAAPYELALIACAFALADRPEVAAVRTRLAALQSPDGALRGDNHTITRSGERDACVEATSFAVLAWLPSPAHVANVRRALEFVRSQRYGNGTFGATQATIAALRALTAYASGHRAMGGAGKLRITEGDRVLAERGFHRGDVDAVEIDLWPMLAPGEHTLQLAILPDGTDEQPSLPWCGEVAYHADLPADDTRSPLAITASLRQASVVEGRTVALDVTVHNTGEDDVPTPIAIVGLPAGLHLDTAVLDDLQRAELFASWELQGNELVLYWRSLAADERRALTFDLVARVPGTTTGPASRTYPYYTPEQKRWAAPLTVEVTPSP